MDAIFFAARQYILEVQTKIAGDGRQTYDEFRETLKQYRRRYIHSSILISTIQTLFRNHPNLLDDFKPFVPSHHSTAAVAPPPAEDAGVRSCVDFLNRVGTRFDGGRTYRKFLECMHAYERAEISASDVFDKVVGLFGENYDLVDEFMRFLPESCVVERSKERKIDRSDHDRNFKRGMKRRSSDSGSSRDDEDSAAVAPRRRRRRRRRMEKYEREKEEAAKRVINRDNEMEDWLCDIDVRIGNLESSRRSALRLYDGLSDGRLSPADVRLDEHFTALNLACIRSLDRKFLEDADGDMVHALTDLLVVLMKKKEALERERSKIVQRWNRIRQSQ